MAFLLKLEKKMGSDQRRVFLAVVLSGVVLVVWQTFFAPKVSVDDKIKAYEQREKVFDNQVGKSNKGLDGDYLKRSHKVPICKN